MMSGLRCISGMLISGTSGAVAVRSNAMPSPQSHRIAAALVRRAGPSADASQLADAAVALWRDIDTALTPIIGTRGLAALQARSLYLASDEFGWMKDMQDTSVRTAIDYDLPRRIFMTQPMPESQAAATVTFLCFHDLLASMVGPSLTARLLDAIWDNPLGGQAAQDESA